jgi:hypothetical protein
VSNPDRPQPHLLLGRPVVVFHEGRWLAGTITRFCDEQHRADITAHAPGQSIPLALQGVSQDDFDLRLDN